jgi:hypothetical protein
MIGLSELSFGEAYFSNIILSSDCVIKVDFEDKVFEN